MKATPSPMVVELSEEFRAAVDNLLTEEDYTRVKVLDAQGKVDFLSRIGCRLVLLPSGQSLRDNIKTPPGSMVYGKLLYGGVTRYRILGGAGNNGGRRPPRKAGERTTIMPMKEVNSTTVTTSKGWVQFGGPDRNYDAIDMGPCGLMELSILPKDPKLGLLGARESSVLEQEPAEALPSPIPSGGTDGEGEEATIVPVERQATEEMVVSQAASFDPKWLFTFPPEEKKKVNATGGLRKNETAASNKYPSDGENYGGVDDIEMKFSTVLGGLRPEIQSF